MNSPNEMSNQNFFKYFFGIVAIGVVLVGIIYFKRQYDASQEIKKTTSYFNKFSNEEYILFAKKLENLIQNGNASEFDNYIRTASLMNFSSENLQESYLKRSVVQAITPHLNIGNYLARQTSHKDDFKFTRFYKEDGVPHYVFRLHSPMITTFYDFTLEIENGELVIADFYNYFNGVVISEYLSNFYYNSINPTATSIASLHKYTKIKRLVDSYEYERAYDLLREIPPSEINVLHYQFLLIASAGLEEEKFLNAIDEFKESQPNNEKLHAYLDFNKSLTTFSMKDLENAIEQLKKHTGNDPIFDYYRGFIQFDAQNFEIALSYFDSTIQNADKFFDAYYLKLFSHLNLNDKEKALVTVRKLKEQFSIDEDYLNQHLIDFEAFIQSEEYKAIFNDAI